MEASPVAEIRKLNLLGQFLLQKQSMGQKSMGLKPLDTVLPGRGSPHCGFCLPFPLTFHLNNEVPFFAMSLCAILK